MPRFAPRASGRPTWTRHRTELQGHGRTGDIDRPITPAATAGDVVALLDELDIDRAHVLGHSMGGAVTLELGVNHPDRIRSLVPISASVRPDGLHEDLTDPARQATSTRMPTAQDFADSQAAYQRSSPHPDHLPGTTHMEATRRAELLLLMLDRFRD